MTRQDKTRQDKTRQDNLLSSGMGTGGIEWFYVLFMLFAGISLAFLTPVFQIPDEPNHFARAWQISEGTLASPVHNLSNKNNLVSFVPSVFFQEKYVGNIVQSEGRYSFKDIADFMSEPVNASRDMRTINNTGSYAPIVYFPQALGAYVVRSVGGTAGEIYYAMRIGAVLFSALCVFMAIRLLPEKGLLIFLLAMMPMYLAESASIAADAVVFGGCMLVSAYILSLTRCEDRLTVRQCVALIVMAVIVGLLKQVYGTVLLLYFLMPYKRLGSRKKYYSFGVIMLAVCLVSSFVWLYFSVSRHGVSFALNKADISAQMEFIKENPFRFLKIIIRSNIILMKFYVNSFIGQLGWLNLGMPIWFKAIYIFLIAAGAALGRLNISIKHRIIMILGFAATVLALDMYEYFAWDQPGSLIIEGVQGRYFIPVSLMALSAFSFLRNIKHEKEVACLVSIMSIAVTLARTYNYFYMS